VSYSTVGLSKRERALLSEWERARKTSVSLGEIARFLGEERLTFRGFQLAKESQAMFWQRYPLETWPGTLQSWARFEEENPFLFENMYLFWCEKA